MTTTLLQYKDQVKAHFDRLSSHISASSPIHRHWLTGLELAGSLPFPSTKDEEWKYTNLKKLLERPLEVSETSVPKNLAAAVSGIPGLDAYTAVFYNGRFEAGLSQLPVGGVHAVPLNGSGPMAEAAAGQLAKHLAPGTNLFVALNTAMSANGLFIHVEKGVALDKPIRLLHLVNAPEGTAFVQPRLLVHAERHSVLQLVEQTVCLAGNMLGNAVSELTLAEGAQVDHYLIQDFSPADALISNVQATLLANSRYTNHTFTLGGGLVRNNLGMAIDGPGCEANMFGLYLVRGKDHIDNHTAVDHKKPHSVSNELYKGIADGHGTAVFNGKIFVREDAQKTNAFQSNKNVMLSDTATVDTKPQLEIWADDVKCSHGATTGALDEEPLFYLRSRGIPQKTAKALLLKAFANELTDKIGLPGLESFVSAKIAAWFDETS